MDNQYDTHTAITFLVIGIGAGALLALLLGPRYGFLHHIREDRLWDIEDTPEQREPV